MGFLNFIERVKSQAFGGLTLETIHKLECKVCPLNSTGAKFRPYGSNKPLIYMLGGSPTKMELKRGQSFLSDAGQVLRMRLPSDVEPLLRWNYCVRSRPPDDRIPASIELEACRPSVEADIENTKPRVVIGFGNVPLQWALKQGGIQKWRGRWIPIQVGSHSCWFFPVRHPYDILDTRKFDPDGPSEYGSEEEFAFAKDIERAIKLADELPEAEVHTRQMALDGVETVAGDDGDDGVDKILDFLDRSYDQPMTGLDYETNGLRPYAKGSKILSVALSTSQGTLSWATNHSEAGWSRKQLEKIESSFEDWLYKYDGRKVVHNLAFEQEWSAYFYGRRVIRAGCWGCSMSQAFILDERSLKGKPGCQSLEFLGIQYFGINLKALSNVDTARLDETPVRTVLLYNGIDAKYHRLLYRAQSQRLADEGLKDVYASHLRRVPTMVLTQLKGVPVDQDVVEKFYERYTDELEVIEAEIADLKVVKKFKAETGEEFRPSANPDVKKLLNDFLGEKVDSTEEKVLKAVDHPIAKLLLRHRSVAKLRSTYVESVRAGSENLFPDGLLHPIVTTTKTETWRTSSDSPNIQNFPVRKHREVRSQIRGGVGKKIVSIDFGQIQARNVAMESKDRNLVKSFWDRHDIHADWVRNIADACPSWVPGGKKGLDDKAVFKDLRSAVKNQFVFPSFFGAQPKSVAGYLGIPEKIGYQMHEQFWEQFPEIKQWHVKLQKFYRKHGYVTGLTGYRRRAPISSNQLINAPIQADEAQIVCSAMARLSELDEPRYQANMEIHDDLTWVWPKYEVERNLEVVIPEMLRLVFDWINVPLLVEVSIGDDWASKEEIGSYASDTWTGSVAKSGSKVGEMLGSWSDGTGWADKQWSSGAAYSRKDRRSGR